jgi:hypothetical protein
MSRRAFLVSRASAPSTIGAAGSTQVAVWWCSLSMISTPSSSAMHHSSRKRS